MIVGFGGLRKLNDHVIVAFGFFTKAPEWYRDRFSVNENKTLILNTKIFPTKSNFFAIRWNKLGFVRSSTVHSIVATAFENEASICNRMELVKFTFRLIARVFDISIPARDLLHHRFCAIPFLEIRDGCFALCKALKHFLFVVG